nr:MAG TPA: hypothetical protein [Caudoviricetes sp.]
MLYTFDYFSLLCCISLYFVVFYIQRRAFVWLQIKMFFPLT